MSVILNASTTTGFVTTADTSGTIVLQNNGTTRLTVSSSGITIPTLNSDTGVLATQNGMTGIAKAWVTFAGAATISASFNVSSVTNISTGVYSVSFTTAMADANYAVNVSGRGTPAVNAVQPSIDHDRTNTTGICYVIFLNSGTYKNPSFGYVAIFSS